MRSQGGQLLLEVGDASVRADEARRVVALEDCTVGDIYNAIVEQLDLEIEVGTKSWLESPCARRWLRPWRAGSPQPRRWSSHASSPVGFAVRVEEATTAPAGLSAQLAISAGSDAARPRRRARIPGKAPPVAPGCGRAVIPAFRRGWRHDVCGARRQPRQRCAVRALVEWPALCGQRCRRLGGGRGERGQAVRDLWAWRRTRGLHSSCNRNVRRGCRPRCSTGRSSCSIRSCCACRPRRRAAAARRARSARAPISPLSPSPGFIRRPTPSLSSSAT